MAWKLEGGVRKMCTARPQWMSISPQPFFYKNKMFQVKFNLDQILDIDKERMVVKVEPNINIGILNRALVSKGLTLPIVPELDQLSIGG